MLIENTRARFGDYTFYLQTFNAAHEAGAVQEEKKRDPPFYHLSNGQNTLQTRPDNYKIIGLLSD